MLQVLTSTEQGIYWVKSVSTEGKSSQRKHSSDHDDNVFGFSLFVSHKIYVPDIKRTENKLSNPSLGAPYLDNTYRVSIN